MAVARGLVQRNACRYDVQDGLKNGRLMQQGHRRTNTRVVERRCVFAMSNGRSRTKT